MDYFDILLAKKLEGGGGGDVTIEQLNVTENGKYSEPGKAYRPVIVNLPLDEKTITANGTYNASADNLKGYNKVVVNIEGYKLKAMPTGAIATITDAAALPLNDLKISIEPVQEGSGDPSPSNVRPITGWTACNISDVGTNMWDEQWEVGGYSETTGQKDNANDLIRCKNYIPVTPNTSYYCTYGNADKIYEVFYYDADKTYINFQLTVDGVVTTPNNCKYMTFRCRAVYGTTYNNDISINYPSTDTSYHAYSGTTYNIEFPSQAGTVYGGTLDVTNGVLTVDRIMINAEDWTNFGVSSETTDVVVFSITLPSEISLSSNFVISNRFSTNIPSGQAGRVVNANVGNVRVLYFVIAKSELSTYDSAGAEEWFDSHHTQFLFVAKTPTTYNLTPTEVKTLLGINNIFADTGDILEGEYFAAL